MTHKPGSALAFSLLYIALLLIVVVGMSYLIGRSFKINTYITENIQAAYNSESAFELGLYSLKLHREGFEDTKHYQGKDIGFGSSDKGALDYSITYQTSPTKNTLEVPISNSDRQFALFYENNKGNISEKNPIISATGKNFTLKLTLPPTLSSILSQNQNTCLQLKLSGKKGALYETVSTSLPCHESPHSLSSQSFIGQNIGSSSPQKMTLEEFLTSHTEVYMIARIIPALPESTENIRLTLTPGETIASYEKQITSVGRYNSLEVTREVLFPQDQSPDLLSIAIMHSK